MNANELPRVEFVAQVSDGLAEHVRSSIGMEAAVICRRFDPIYFLDWNQDLLFAVFDEKARGIPPHWSGFTPPLTNAAYAQWICRRSLEMSWFRPLEFSRRRGANVVQIYRRMSGRVELAKLAIWFFHQQGCG